MIGCSDVSLGFGGSPQPRGAGPALSGGPVSGGTVPPADHLAPEPGPERAGGGAGHRLRAALGRRGRAPLREGGPDGLGDRRRGNAAPGRCWGPRTRRRCGPRWPSRPPTAGCGRGRRWRRGWRPARPQGPAAARVGLPQGARLQRPGAQAAARRGGEPRGAGGVQKKLAAEVGERRERDPGRAVEVWTFGERRLGLRPVLRRRWAPKDSGRSRSGGTATSGSTSTASSIRAPARWSGSFAPRSTPSCSAPCWPRSPRQSAPARAS